MARRIELRTGYRHPADRVFAALTDQECVRERLASIGGESSELVSFTANGDSTRIVMRQGIDAAVLPSVVRRVTPNGVTIERTETWQAGNRGTVEASVQGFTGSLRAAAAVVADAATGSELVLDGEVKVGIPLIGGKIEAVIAEQIGRLLSAEAKFTDRWLESRPA